METLSDIQRRVLGALLEKSFGSSEYYPMTLNAITAACNQKNNRDPVLELDEDAVWHSLEHLRHQGLVARVLPPMGSRTDRFKHEVDAKWQLPKAQKAILTELLLRGPQTPGELRSRASRLYAFENLDAVTAAMDWLATQSPVWIMPLPRAAGQSAIRFRHCLYPAEEAAAIGTGEPPAAARIVTGNAGANPIGQVVSAASHAAAVGPQSADLAALREQVESLQSEVAELHELIAALRRRVDTLEGR